MGDFILRKHIREILSEFFNNASVYADLPNKFPSFDGIAKTPSDLNAEFDSEFNFLHDELEESKVNDDLNESTITKKEFEEMKRFLKSGGVLQNDVAGYHILIRKDGQRVFEINGNYKFFKDDDSFIRSAIITVKRG